MQCKSHGSIPPLINLNILKITHYNIILFQACKTVTEELADLEKQKLENEKIKVTAQAELENEKSKLSMNLRF